MKSRIRRFGTPKTISIPQAGWEYWGLGEGASYEAAARGDIPYIQVGGLKRVPIAAMEAKLAAASSAPPKPPDAPVFEERDEIEITPEMIEAGMRELYYFSPKDDPVAFAEEIVSEIYRAMTQIRQMRREGNAPKDRRRSVAAVASCQPGSASEDRKHGAANERGRLRGPSGH